MEEVYVLVDIEKKTLISHIQVLPKNWKNISNLDNLAESQLKNLSWAGYPNLGWINIKSDDIVQFNSTEENLNLNKRQFKNFVREKINHKIKNGLIKYNNIELKYDDQTRIDFFIKSLIETNSYFFRINDSIFNLTKEQIKEAYTIIENKRNYYFEIENNIFKMIDSYDSISDFNKINLNFLENDE